MAASAQLYISSGTEFYIAPSEQFTSAEQVQNSGTLTIAAGATATLNGGATGTGVIKGTATSNLVIGGTSTTGTYYFDQTTPGTTNVLKDLTLSGSTTATLGSNLNITAGATAGTVIVGSGTTLNAAGKLIIKSNATGTARIGASSGTISGDVVVERYLPATRRAYRFLAAPVTTTGGVFASWQESGTNATGLGIQVTGFASATPGVDATSGLDKSLTGNSSMFTYNGSAWAAVTNTKSTQLTPGAGFRVLVRGDRTTDLYASSTPAATATTIKATGAVGQGTVTLSSLVTGFNLLGNPYPSSIDWDASGWQALVNGVLVASLALCSQSGSFEDIIHATFPDHSRLLHCKFVLCECASLVTTENIHPREFLNGTQSGHYSFPHSQRMCAYSHSTGTHDLHSYRDGGDFQNYANTESLEEVVAFGEDHEEDDEDEKGGDAEQEHGHFEQDLLEVAGLVHARYQFRGLAEEGPLACGDYDGFQVPSLHYSALIDFVPFVFSDSERLSGKGGLVHFQKAWTQPCICRDDIS